MAHAIGAVLAFAVGVGISPIPIIAGIVVLFSARARINGPAFLLAWMAGLTAIVTVVVLLAESADVGDGGSADQGQSWLKVLLGAALLAGAVRRWRGRPGPDEQPEAPGWMAKVDDLGPGGAIGLGAVLSANPKNLALAVGAGTSLVAIGPDTSEAVVGIVTFVLIGSAALIVAVGWAAVGGDRARRSLTDARTWLTRNDDAVMAVLFVVFGAVLISNGLGGT